MSYERAQRPARPILPADLEGTVRHWASRGIGVLLLLAAAAGWLSLATWSADDPSLTHATSSTVRNWLSLVGAVTSDLLLQMLGFAAILIFLPPATVGYALAVESRRQVLGLRLSLFPLAILAAAGALSALPAPASFPINHGLGGLVGDGVIGFAEGLIAIVDLRRSTLIAGLGLAASASWLLVTSLGLRDVAVLFAGDAAHHLAGWAKARLVACRRAQPVRRAADDAIRAPDGGSIHPDRGRTAAPIAHSPGEAAARPDVPAPPVSCDAPGERVEPAGAPWETLQSWTAPDLAGSEDRAAGGPRALPSFLTAYRRVGPPVASEAERGPARAPAPDSAMLADPFEAGPDLAPDRGSRAMARRFAPSAAATVRQASGPRLAGLGSIFPYRAAEPAWRRPSLNLLERPAAARPGPELAPAVLRGNARLLEDVLADFGIEGAVTSVRPGPVVTLFEVVPAAGIKPARIAALADDIARAMGAAAARVCPVRGRASIGIELPNVRRETVPLRDMLESEAWRKADGTLPLALGRSVGGEPVLVDLARLPHLLVAGAAGSGRSVGLRAMILSLIYRHAPADCRLLLIDPKMLGLAVYDGLPHLLAPVLTSPREGAAALAWAVTEMEERQKRMAELGVRSVDIYNNRVRNAKKRGELIARRVQTGFDGATGEPRFEEEALDLAPMPAIVIFIDELADLLAVAGSEVEATMQRLSEMARAVGIHLVAATRHPAADASAAVKASLPARIAFKVASKADSRAVLDETGAEQLLGAGDMLFAAASGPAVRVQGAFVSDEDVERVVAALRERGEPAVDAGLARALVRCGVAGDAAEPGVASTAGRSPLSGSEDADDELFDRAVAIVHRQRKASTSTLQRRLAISYARAAELIARMEREGLVSPPDSAGRRHLAGAT